MELAVEVRKSDMGNVIFAEAMFVTQVGILRAIGDYLPILKHLPISATTDLRVAQVLAATQRFLIKLNLFD